MPEGAFAFHTILSPGGRKGLVRLLFLQVEIYDLPKNSVTGNFPPLEISPGGKCVGVFFLAVRHLFATAAFDRKFLLQHSSCSCTPSSSRFGVLYEILCLCRISRDKAFLNVKHRTREPEGVHVQVEGFNRNLWLKAAVAKVFNRKSYNTSYNRLKL